MDKNCGSIAESEPEIQNQRRKKQVTKKNIKKKKNANEKRITANDDVQNDNAEVNDGEDIQNNDPDIIENEVEELFDTIETGEPNLPVIDSSDAGSNDEEIDNDVEHAEIQNEVVVEGDELEIGSEVTIHGSGKKISKPDTWKCNVRKRKRNCGEAYIAKSGKEIQAKMYVFTDCSCRFKCNENVPNDVRQQIHEQFWNLNDWNNQTQFIVQNVMVCAIKRRKTADPEASHKQASYIPYLNGKRVCKLVFLTTLGISNKRYHYAITRKRDSGTGIATSDKRGYKSPPNKTPQAKTDFIREHIDSFPKFTSHYGRASSTRQYLSPDLTIAKMHSLYKDECEKLNMEPCKLWVYQRIFGEFNLHFYTPKTDTCRICDKLDNRKSAAEEETVKAEIENE